MKTIAEPKRHIDDLWGKQKIVTNYTYRLMKYVIHTNCEGNHLLHNVITGQLVELDQEETKVLTGVPLRYTSTMDKLIECHFLVPEDYDEYHQVKCLRKVLGLLTKTQGPKDIVGYTVLPTTACNARCYYCFEKGSRTSTMSEQTANDLVDFITSHCGKKKTVTLIWFGGEPTIAANRIDQICTGLRKNGISFQSKMITNGYLFDEEMVSKAKGLWNLNGLQICVDGLEENYNSIKDYVGTCDNPYQRVMRNIELLIGNEIRVGLRMNFDLGNYKDFYKLVEEVIERFGNSPLLRVGVHPVIGEHRNKNGELLHGTDEWFTKMLVELNSLVIKKGLKNVEMELPYLNYEACSAYNDSTATITPEGNIVRCPEKFGDDQITGNLHTGITNHELVKSWKEIADFPMCADCALHPNCLRLVNCSNTTYCHKSLYLYKQCEDLIYNTFLQAKAKN